VRALGLRRAGKGERTMAKPVSDCPYTGVGRVAMEHLIPLPFDRPAHCRPGGRPAPVRACNSHENVSPSSRHYYSELPQLISLLLKDRSLFLRIRYALFKR
jgi:hypothetical protein